MPTKYDKKLADEYIVLRAKNDTTETLEVENGTASQLTKYDTEAQVDEIIEAINGKYTIGFATMFDLRLLGKLGDLDTAEITYGEISKLLKKMFPELPKTSFEGYCEMFDITGDSEAEKTFRLYEAVKEGIKQFGIEKQIIGTSRKKFEVKPEDLKIISKGLLLDVIGEEDDDEQIPEDTDDNIFDMLDVDENFLDDEEEPDFDDFSDLDTEDFEDLDNPEFGEFIEDDSDFDDYDNDEDDEDLDYSDVSTSMAELPEEEKQQGVYKEELHNLEPLNLGAVEKVQHNDDVLEDFDAPVTTTFSNANDSVFFEDEELVVEDHDPKEEIMLKEDTIAELEVIFNTYHTKGHYLWTKWMALQVSRAETLDVTEVYHVAGAGLEGNYLREFYFHLRDDLHTDIPEEMQEYTARTQIMGMCLDAVINKGFTRLYSEIAEGMYDEYVLSQTESIQSKEIADLKECDLDPYWLNTLAPILGKATFPLGKDLHLPEEDNDFEIETNFEPEIDLDNIEDDEDDDDGLPTSELYAGEDYEEVDDTDLPDPREPVPLPDLEGYLDLPEPVTETDYAEPIQKATEDTEDELYEVCEDTVAEDLKPKKKDRKKKEKEIKPKKEKKKGGFFKKFLKFVLWLLIVASMAGMCVFSYGTYTRNKALREDNIKLSYELKTANENIKTLSELQTYKDKAQAFDQHILEAYKAKNYNYVKGLIEAFYGKNVDEYPDIIKPIYNGAIAHTK